MVKQRLYAGLSYESVVNDFSDTVTRIWALHCGNFEDAKDCYQQVFLKLYMSDIDFTTTSYLKAWLIRVSVTTSLDYIKQYWKKNIVFLSSSDSVRSMVDALIAHSPEKQALCSPHDTQLLVQVLSLPLKYRQILYLYYYEELKVTEISQLLSKSPGTVKSQLSRGRSLLKKKLIKSGFEGANYEELI